jgi:polyhydroxybutyrate depolymerase
MCRPAIPSALVLSLHGGGGTGIGQQGLTDFGYDKGSANARGASPADRRHVDDVGFLVALAGKLGVGVACHSSRPVSVWEAHRTADPLVPFNGGKVRGRGGVSHSISVDTTMRALDGSEAIAQFFLAHARD